MITYIIAIAANALIMYAVYRIAYKKGLKDGASMICKVMDMVASKSKTMTEMSEQ